MLIGILIILIICITYTYSETVNNESDFRNLVSNDKNEIEINLQNKIYITNNLNITKSIQKISIIGNSKENSGIDFKNIQQQIYFGENVEEIEIKNLSITGNIYFDDIKKISIHNVAIYGNINSNFIENDYVKLSNVTYISSSFLTENCINLSGNVEISYSSFKGSSLCKNRLLMFNGNNEFSITINDSYFSGEYQCTCISIENAPNSSIDNSTVEKGYGSISIAGGAGLRMSHSSGSVKNCTFKDHFSTQSGGSFSLITAYRFYGENLEIYNTTSLATGSMAHVITDYNVQSNAFFMNIRHYKSGGFKNMKGGGLIMCVEQAGNVKIINYYAEDLINNETAGAAFIMTGESTLNMKTVEINNIVGHHISGLFFFTYNVNSEKNVVFKAVDVKLNNLRDFSSRASAGLIWVGENTNTYLENVHISNFEGTNDHLIYATNYCETIINGLYIDNFYTKTAEELIYFDSNDGENIVLKNIKINNIRSRGPLFRIAHGKMTLSDIEVTNSHMCDFNTECRNKDDLDSNRYESDIILIGPYSEINLTNSYFADINGIRGFTSAHDSIFNYKNNTFYNCYFKKGIYHIDNDSSLHGKYYDEDSKYINIRSEYGSIMHIKSFNERSDSLLNIKNALFQNNSASKYGGVIYSLSKYSNKYVKLIDCEFQNNTAIMGYISYSLKKESEPEISNIDELRKEKGAIATNPTKIKLNDNSLYSISILSGEKLPEGIACNIYDDYDNLLTFEADISNIEFSEFMFYQLNINDTYNAELYGQTQSYCWGDSCLFPQIKVIGNPGIYTIRLKINAFGKFSKFENNYIDKEIEITECNTVDNIYLYQSIDSPRLKSCYKPFCNQGCGPGKCVNNDLCNCNGTLFTGDHCNEYYKMERKKIIDDTLRTIGIVIIIAIIIITALTIKFRKDPIIKGGSIDFLIIILFGSIINIIYMFFLTVERTTSGCIFSYIFNNMGFSLVFGSILVKSLRIYKIFRVAKKKNYGLRKITMYSIVIGIVLYHVIACIIFIYTDTIRVAPYLTEDYLQYYKCVYSKIKLLSTMLNFSILLVGCFLSYFIRNVKKNFKENLTVPVYVYVLFTIITEMVNLQEGISLKVQDLFGSVSTIINTSVTLYFLYVSKFIDIYDEAVAKKIRSNPNSTYGSKNTLKESNSNIKNSNSNISKTPSYNQINNMSMKPSQSFGQINNSFINKSSQVQLTKSQSNTKIFNSNVYNQNSHSGIELNKSFSNTGINNKYF